jgi:DNA repair photolyase
VTLRVFEDSTRNILSKNDSPDVGFTYSVNPYRGCQHACAYCLAGDTRVLMADGGTKTIESLRVGEEIIGTDGEGGLRRYVRTRVYAHWSTVKPAVRVTLEDGTTIVASPDHRLLSSQGWRYVGASPRGELRPQLTTNDRLMGIGRVAASAELTPDYRRGYLCGMIVGDALLATVDRPRRRQPVKSEEALRVTAIEPLGVVMKMFDITTGTGDFIANGVISHNCYARPSHEYLGFGAGTDFETRIVVKPDAPELLREAFEKKSWKGDLVMFSGVTDCYQPLEASYRLTRGCLEVCAEYRNPVAIITKAPLIERDIDVLVELSKVTHVAVTVSVPFWDADHARAIEPFVATPQRRVKTIERLAEAGIEVGVNVAPIIPGLSDSDIPAVLEAARKAGATHAGMVLLRLPGSVKQVFEERVRAALPLRAEKILARVRETRGGKMYDSRYGLRQVGEGEYAEMITSFFVHAKRKAGYPEDNDKYEVDEPSTFKRPTKGQLPLF